MAPLEIVEIPVEKIDFNQKNVPIYGTLIDDAGNIIVDKIKSLLASMDKVGQREPITVVESQTRYRVLSGNRRLAAAKTLKWESLKAVILPKVSEQDEDTLIVSHNVTRNKSYTEKLAELEVYKRMFKIKDADLEDSDVDHTIKRDDKSGREEITLKDFVSSSLDMGTTKLQQLLYVHKYRPDLVKDIDDDKYSVHSAYMFVTNEQEQKDISSRLQPSEPDFDLEFDSERKYANAIVGTFRKEVSRAKTMKRGKFSLVELLKTSIQFHEKQLDALFDSQGKLMSKLFEGMNAALNAGRFTIFHTIDGVNIVKMGPVFLESDYAIKKDSNGKYGRDELGQMRDMVLRYLFDEKKIPLIKIKSLKFNPESLRVLKHHQFDYLMAFSKRYTLQKEIKGARISPTRRKEINHLIGRTDRQLRVFLRILAGVTTPLERPNTEKAKSPKTKSKAAKVKSPNKRNI